MVLGIIFGSIGGLLLIFILVILIRTLNFKPKDNVKVDETEIDFDKQKPIDNLQQLIRCKTVSYYDHTLEDNAEFDKLINLLPTLYPNVFKTCSFNKLEDRGLLFKWTGKNHEHPSVMMAHYDVVPVNEDKWDKPAFEGIIENGILWGRGAIDTKVTFNGVLTAADHLISKGFVPENDLYFAFSGQEEINGLGAVHIVDYFKANNITPYLVVDEGGAVVDNVFPGVSKPTACIGIAEKGMLNLSFSCSSAGGHASAPSPHTPLGLLSAACEKVENNPFQSHITKPIAEMYDTLGRYSTFVYRMIFANLWLFKGVLDGICRKSGGTMNALMRTTVAFTQAKGSSAPNVIPPEAEMVANIRLNPEDSVDSAVEYIKNTINDENVKLTVGVGAMNPSPISETDCDQWDKVASAVASTWKGCVVAPYLMVQCSDSRHYGEISKHVYKFSAQHMTKEELASIHGNNEKITLEQIDKATEFYIRLMKQC